MSNLQQSKKEYNELLKRWKKYEIYMGNNDIGIIEKLKWISEGKKLTYDLSNKLEEISKLGGGFIRDDVFEGFLI